MNGIGLLRKIHNSTSGPVVVDFYLHPDDISHLIIEDNNKVAYTSTPVLDYLELVTARPNIWKKMHKSR
jgi:hypothetical protein